MPDDRALVGRESGAEVCEKSSSLQIKAGMLSGPNAFEALSCFSRGFSQFIDCGRRSINLKSI